MSRNTNSYNLSVLIANHDSLDRRSIMKTLAQIADEVKITECKTAAEAFSLLTQKQFDVALISQNLPDELGTDLLRKLKASDKLNVPIILLTENDDLEEEIIRLGADESLSKEARGVQHFRRAIRYSVERHKLWKELGESRERERRERELRLIEEAEPTSIDSVKTGQETFEKNFSQYYQTYAQIFSAFVADNSFKREKQSPEQIKEFAKDLGSIFAGPKDLVSLHRAFLESSTKDKTAKREESLINESRYFLLQLMGELLMYYRDKNNGVRADD